MTMYTWYSNKDNIGRCYYSNFCNQSQEINIWYCYLPSSNICFMFPLFLANKSADQNSLRGKVIWTFIHEGFEPPVVPAFVRLSLFSLPFGHFPFSFSGSRNHVFWPREHIVLLADHVNITLS